MRRPFSTQWHIYPTLKPTPTKPRPQTTAYSTHVPGGPLPQESIATWQARSSLVNRALQMEASEEENEEMPFESQVAMLAGLHELTRKDDAKLDEILQLASMPTVDLEDSLSRAEKLCELDRLIQMAKHQEELAVSAFSGQRLSCSSVEIFDKWYWCNPKDNKASHVHAFITKRIWANIWPVSLSIACRRTKW